MNVQTDEYILDDLVPKLTLIFTVFILFLIGARLFPSYPWMIVRYPLIKNKPFLLPFAWIYRFVVQGVRNHRGLSAEYRTLRARIRKRKSHE